MKRLSIYVVMFFSWIVSVMPVSSSEIEVLGEVLIKARKNWKEATEQKKHLEFLISLAEKEVAFAKSQPEFNDCLSRSENKLQDLQKKLEPLMKLADETENSYIALLPIISPEHLRSLKSRRIELCQRLGQAKILVEERQPSSMHKITNKFKIISSKGSHELELAPPRHISNDDRYGRALHAMWYIEKEVDELEETIYLQEKKAAFLTK